MAITHIIKAVTVRNGRETFCRGGRAFSVHGTPVDRDDFEDDAWARLKDEPMLHIREARKDEIEAVASLPEPVQGDALEALKLRVDETIQNFGPEAFGTDGLPKLGSLRDALPEDKAQIDKRLRDAVWADMVSAGFQVPVAQD